MKSKTTKPKSKSKKISAEAGWQAINPHAAGVDIGAREHGACVPAESSPTPVRKFGTFTADLEALAQWFKECGVTTVAMESTGVYWIPRFQILERAGLQVLLVNARQTKNVSGRKSDVLDCQWIQKLHTFGLLQASFRPADPYCVLRTYLRYRDELVGARSTQCQHLQKALQQMNVQLTQVLSDVTGVSGQAIIQAILAGERDRGKLAGMVSARVRATRAEIERARLGDYRKEHLFVLQQAYDLHQIYEAKILACDEQMVAEADQLPQLVDVTLLPPPARKPGRPACRDQMGGQDLRALLYGKFGVDVTAGHLGHARQCFRGGLAGAASAWCRRRLGGWRTWGIWRCGLAGIRPWIEPAQSFAKNQLGLGPMFFNPLRRTRQMRLWADSAVRLRTMASLNMPPQSALLAELQPQQMAFGLAVEIKPPSTNTRLPQ